MPARHARTPAFRRRDRTEAATVSDQGVVTAGAGADGTDLASQFLQAISAHRHWERTTETVPA
jgi:predicted glycosyltransferase